MSFFYLDSSALFKRYVTEKGSSWVLSIFNQHPRSNLAIARITQVEFAAALARRTLQGRVQAQHQTLALRLFTFHLKTRYQTVEIDPDICNHAAQLAHIRALRAYDSVQLACALKAHTVLIQAGLSGVTFISSDADLLNAALLEGLAVENPEDHP